MKIPLTMILSLVGAPIYAQEVSGDAIAAYQRGHNDGWNACKADPQCSYSGPGTAGAGTSVGMSGISSGGGSSGQVYQIPDVLLGTNGEGLNYRIPSDWLVAPSADGAGILVQVDETGGFRPFIRNNEGHVLMETLDQLPLWTTDQGVKELLGNLPKGADGTVFVPVEPSSAP